nr:hypothetical protein [Aneurinibacillus terranovensis]
MKSHFFQIAVPTANPTPAANDNSNPNSSTLSGRVTAILLNQTRDEKLAEDNSNGITQDQLSTSSSALNSRNQPVGYQNNPAKWECPFSRANLYRRRTKECPKKIPPIRIRND